MRYGVGIFSGGGVVVKSAIAIKAPFHIHPSSEPRPLSQIRLTPSTALNGEDFHGWRATFRPEQ
jgi:hypothetical protein